MNKPLGCLFILFCSLLVASVWSQAPRDYQNWKVFSFPITNATELKILANLVSRIENVPEGTLPNRGVDIWANQLRINGNVDIAADSSFFSELTNLGIPYLIMYEDLKQAIDNLYQVNEQARTAADSDFFDAYRLFNEYQAFYRYLAATYSNLAQYIEIGTTVEGRPIFGIQIGGGTANDPAIVYNGCQHAREWISGMTNTYIAYNLLFNYATDPEVRDLVNKIRWYIFPIINGDGYVYTFTSDRMWRKNRRYNSDSWFGCYGVDTNRNWGFQWNTGGSSSNTCSDTYHGPRAFSEPESTSLANFIGTLSNVKGYIDWHAYSQLWMTPWGYTGTLPVDYAAQRGLAGQCVAAIRSLYGKVYEYGNIYDIIYPASGGSEDWTYGARNITYSYAVELRDTGQFGFLLPPDQIRPQGLEIFASVKVMGKQIISESEQ